MDKYTVTVVYEINTVYNTTILSTDYLIKNIIHCKVRKINFDDNKTDVIKKKKNVDVDKYYYYLQQREQTIPFVFSEWQSLYCDAV